MLVANPPDGQSELGPRPKTVQATVTPGRSRAYLRKRRYSRHICHDQKLDPGCKVLSTSRGELPLECQ